MRSHLLHHFGDHVRLLHRTDLNFGGNFDKCFNVLGLPSYLNLLLLELLDLLLELLYFSVCTC